MEFNEAIEKFLTYIETKGYSKATLKDYRGELSRFNNWLAEKLNGPVYLEEVTLDEIEDYLTYKKSKGNSATTRSRFCGVVKSFYNYLFKKGLAENIAVALESPKTRKKKRAYLTGTEMEAVLKAINKPIIYATTLFLYQTGARISEAINLTFDDLDFQNLIVHIRDGKGRKDRDIPMTTRLKEELESYIKNHRGEVDSDYVFATSRSGSLSRVYFNTCLKQAVKKAGINKEITAHSIRRSTAILMARRGVNVVDIQAILGHESLETTSIYLDSNLKVMRDAINVI